MIKLFSVLQPPFSAALVAIALTGCATKPNELRQQSPETKFVSLKSSKQIAECIVDRWQHVPFAGALTSRRTSKGYTIVQTENGGVGADPAFTTDVNDGPTGTETNFYTSRPIGHSYYKFQDSVKECQ